MYMYGGYKYYTRSKTLQHQHNSRLKMNRLYGIEFETCIQENKLS